MKYAYQNIRLEEALQIGKETMDFVFLPPIEMVPLVQGVGRVVAQNYSAPFPQPPFHRSAVDGYAVRCRDIEGASNENPIILSVIEEVYAGQFPQNALQEGTAIRIMTGAPIPTNADAVIMQEHTDYGDIQVTVYGSLKCFSNICMEGEDFKEGTCLIKKGTLLKAAEIGLLASMGYDTCAVYKKLKIGLFTTGNELVDPGKRLNPGKIYNSNQFLLYARLQEMGFEPILVEHLSDDEVLVSTVLKNAAEQVDFIITTGGVSVGKKDIMHEALTLAGAKGIFWKIQVKPGSPTIFSVLKQVPILSLSGNPYGALANLELLVKPMLLFLSGQKECNVIKIKAYMEEEYEKSSKCKRFIRGVYENGTVKLSKGLQTSGVLGTMRGCNCLIEIPEQSTGLKKGDFVEVVPLY